MEIDEKIKNKNRLHQESAPSYSETSSGDVHSNILGSATDTAQASKNAFTNIENITQSAKNNIKKYFNGDFHIDYNRGFMGVVVGLRKLLRLRYKGGSNYAQYLTPNGVFSFRLSDHNANGNNFKDKAINVSVYVAFRQYDNPESNIEYTEYKISPNTFYENPLTVVNAILNGINNALNGGLFSIDEKIANKQEYKIQENMKMNRIKITESELQQIVAESVKKVLKEDFQINLTNNGKEGWNNVNKWRAAANEIQTKGSTIINIPLDYDNFLQANFMKTQRGGIYLETKGFRKEYTSISDAFKGLQDYANNIMKH